MTRKVLLVFSFLGTLFFAAAFALSLVNPLQVERTAREVIRLEIEARVGQRIDALSNSRLISLAQRKLNQNQQAMDDSQRALREEAHRKIGNVIADMLKVDCECRQRLVERARQYEVVRLESLTRLQQDLQGFVESAYASVAAKLMREFQIFTGSNALALALLGAVTWVRRRASLQLVLPAVVVLGAALITGYFYLFQQNWLHTILFGQYVGLGYVGYLSAVAALLADVVFNRARVTSAIVNLIGNVAGVAATATPC